jgi:uncharacterized protein YuzE
MTDLMGDIWTVYGADGEVVGIEIRGLGAT